jgi:predicted nuclease with TOPRIM domain
MEEIQQDDKSQRERIGKLNAEKVAHDKMLRKRFAKMEKIADKYNIELAVSQTQNTQTQNASFISTQNSIAESVGDTTVLSQDTMLSISVEDMHQFLRALEDKEADLQQSLRNYTDQSQKQVDAIQDKVNEMTAQSKATEHGT